MSVTAALHAALHAAVLAGLVALALADTTTTDRVRFCGRSLSQAVSMVCRSYNSPAWDEGSLPVRNRVRRELGIVDECCNEGCTWDALKLYCADDEPGFPSANIAVAGAVSEEQEHLIADRSVEAAAAGAAGGELAAPASFRGLFGRSEMGMRGAARAAPVLGTVSPLLTWGRTMHADLPPRDRLVYVP